MHPSQKAQIVHLKANKAFTKVFSKYANFVVVFLPKLAAELSKYTGINCDDLQPYYSLSHIWDDPYLLLVILQLC